MTNTSDSLNNRLFKVFSNWSPLVSGQPTIKDVAEVAGVCASTASRALAGKGPQYRISPLTVEKVREAARQIQYRGSAVARSLRTQRSGLIGVVVPDIANPVFAAIVGAATREVEQRGYGVLIADSRESTERESSHIDGLTSRQVEGLIVCPVGETPAHLVATADAGVPIVTVDRVFGETSIPTVKSDQRHGAELTVQALIDAGHSVIGCLQGISKTVPTLERVDGYRTACKAAGLAIEDSLFAGSAFTIESGASACVELLVQRHDVTAIFALSNQIAVGVLHSLKELGLTVPKDISLAAFDDHPLAPFLTPALTACDQDEQQMGREAAALLLEQITTGRLPEKPHRVVPVTFRSRGSIAAPRTGPLKINTSKSDSPASVIVAQTLAKAGGIE